MFGQLLQRPAHRRDQTVQNFNDCMVHPAEGLFQHDLIYTADFCQQTLPNSPNLVSNPPQRPTSEAHDTVAQWSYTPHTWNAGQLVQLPVTHHPAPRYPPGYFHEIDHPSLVGGYTTPDLSATDTTPVLTDSQSELLHSPALEDFFAYIPRPLRHENAFQEIQPLPEPHALCFSTVFSAETPNEGESTLRGFQETQAQAPGYYKSSNIHVSEHPARITHIVPLKFSRESYNVLLQTRGPVPREIKALSNGNPHSFVVLDRRGCHPVISISETGGELSDITIDFNGIIVVLTEDNFCRVPGCGYWSKNAGRVPRHRLTHFTDRGFECQNPIRRGANAPKQMQCQLGPRQYLTRLDLFKKHCRAPSCQGYAPSFTQDSQRNSWRGPDNVDESYLLPFTRDVHIPFILRTHKS